MYLLRITDILMIYRELMRRSHRHERNAAKIIRIGLQMIEKLLENLNLCLTSLICLLLDQVLQLSRQHCSITIQRHCSNIIAYCNRVFFERFETIILFPEIFKKIDQAQGFEAKVRKRNQSLEERKRGEGDKLVRTSYIPKLEFLQSFTLKERNLESSQSHTNLKKNLHNFYYIILFDTRGLL